MEKKILEVKPAEVMVSEFLKKCQEHQQELEKAAKERESNPLWQQHFNNHG